MPPIKLQQFADDEQHLLEALFKPIVDFLGLRRYVRRARQPFIALEGLQRVSQAIVNHCTADPLDINKLCYVVRDFFEKSAIPPVELGAQIVALLAPAFDLSPDNRISLRNFCFVLLITIEFHADEDFYFNESTLRQMLHYASSVLAALPEEQHETVQYAVLVINKLLATSPSLVIDDQLHASLTRLAEYLQPPDGTTVYNLLNMQPPRYNAAILAQWILEQHSAPAKGETALCKLQITSDGLTVFNSSLSKCYLSTRSAFCVTSSEAVVYYYEAIPLTSGSVSVGWSTNEARYDGFYRCRYNVTFNRQSQTIEYKGNKHYISGLARWQAGDVIGCLLDRANRQFTFYLNGRPLENPLKKIHFSGQPYFAYANVESLNCCAFNFGQIAFKYPPEVAFTSFHEATNGALQSYRLLEPFGNISGFGCWFKCETPSQFFVDSRQRDFEQWIVDAQTAVLAGNANQEVELEELKKRVKKLLVESEGLNQLRFFQAILEQMDNTLEETEKEKVFEWIMNTYSDANDDRNLNVDKQLEFFYHYMQRSDGGQPESHQMRRNLCMLLTHRHCSRLFAYYNCTKDIVALIIGYVLCYEDKWTLNLANQTVDSFLMSGVTPEPELFCKLNINSELAQLVAHLGQYSSLQLYDSPLDRLRYQLLASARWYLANRHLPSNELQAMSDAHYSNDYFAVNGVPTNFVSVQSAFLVHSAVFYYEVLLFTPARDLRIGWAHQRADLNSDNAIGEGATSIGVSSRSIWHLVETPLGGAATEWKEGDTVGALIDVPNQVFAFYHNGQRIQFPENLNVTFARRPYFAAASLSFGQKCYFNFGQLPFKYPPADFQFEDFHSATAGCLLKYRLLEQANAA